MREKKGEELNIYNLIQLSIILYLILNSSNIFLIFIVSWAGARIAFEPSFKPLISFKKLKIRYLPRKVDYYATTFIFNEVVAIQLLKEKPIVIKIESRDIAEGYKIDFDLLWKIAKKWMFEILHNLWICLEP